MSPMHGKLSMKIAIGVVLAFALVPFIPDAHEHYLFFYLFLVFVNIIVAQGWNVVAGYTGQISLAQHA
ncbi:MAG: hypothetical protein LC125_14885, partial [Burkholderiales bacterium]|nr:hypothetical protein [Burkholderiales bacterium]